jgi:beta-lactamase class A
MNNLLRGCALLIGAVQLTFGPVAIGLASESVLQADEQKTDQPAVASIARIEQALGGRLGVAVLDTGGGRRLEYHAGDRFPICSTFKFLAAAAVLQKVDKKELQLDRKISYGPADLLEWAPITKQHVQEGSMILHALCAAAIEYSDNTAGNLLLQTIGGPPGLTEFVRSLADSVTRLDRNEPTLNTAIKGDERDTTSPASMLTDLKTLLLGDTLSAASRQQLEVWLVKNTTGDKRLRAGLPATWQVGDKTGTGENGARGDIAIVRPPNRAPILVAVYTAESAAPNEKINEAFAAIGRVVGDGFGVVP